MDRIIAYLGTPGSFNHLCAIQCYGNDNTFVGTSSNEDVARQVEAGTVNYGVIPIENDLTGTIAENRALFEKYNIFIVGERYSKPEVHLLVIKNTEQDVQKRLIKINKILSHPRTLDMCRKFLEEHPWIEPALFRDTASAAKYVSSKSEENLAAIGSAQAAKLHNLDILVENIQDSPIVYSRFLLVGPTIEKNDSCSKITVVFTEKNAPGELCKALSLFTQAGANLTKIESRINPKGKLSVEFVVDYEFIPEQMDIIEDAIERLKKQVLSVKILGFYKKDSLFD